MNQHHQPQLHVCPDCGNVSKSTACRFCGISLLPSALRVVRKPTPTPVVIDPDFESGEGAVRVAFRGELGSQRLRIRAVIAPADPEVGILDPYPLELTAVNEAGRAVPLSYPEARYLASTVFHQLF